MALLEMKKEKTFLGCKNFLWRGPWADPAIKHQHPIVNLLLLATIDVSWLFYSLFYALFSFF